MGNDLVLISLKKEELESLIKGVIHSELVASKENEKNDHLMNAQEICDYLGIHMSTLNKWKAENKIPYKKLGKRVFFNRTEVTQALKDSNYYKMRELR